MLAFSHLFAPAALLGALAQVASLMHEKREEQHYRKNRPDHAGIGRLSGSSRQCWTIPMMIPIPTKARQGRPKVQLSHGSRRRAASV
jgi:hypothetical protein